MTSFILYEFPLLSTVELKFGQSIFQFILRFKTGIFEWGHYAYFNFFPNSQKENWKFAFVNVALVGLSNFFQFTKWQNIDFLYFQISPNSLKSWKTQIFKFHLLSYFVRLRILFQAWYVSRRWEANLWLNCQFSKKEMFIFMQEISAENTVSKLNWG